MRAWLIQIDAWDGANPYPVRMASHDDERLCHLDDKTWWPVIARLPTLRYDFFDGGFDAGSITSPSGDVEAAIEAIPSLPALAIHDARIRIWGGMLGDAFNAFTLKFDGRVKEQPTVDAGSMSISFGADDGWLDEPLLSTYAGTGGAEGGPDLEGQVKQLALGAPRFASATLVDAVDNIYQLSGYGPIGGVEVAFERLNRFGPSVGNAANFASLKASTVPRGQWATCLSQGFVKFGAPPEGMLCFHLNGDVTGGWSRLPGDLIRRVADIRGHGDRVATGDVATLNGARPWPMSMLVTAQTTARDLIQKIAMSVNAVAYVDWLGMLRLAQLGIGAPTVTLAADGSSLPPVSDVRQVAVSAPYWKIAQGAAVTWQVHGLNDIAFSAPLNPRGPYDPEEVYREGDMVTLPNGSQWLFVGALSAAGSTPALGNSDWFQLSDAITASNITYDDGQTVEALKPAEAGATKGAPEGTYVAGTPAVQIISDLMLNGLNWHDLSILTEGRDALMLARTTLDGKEIKTVITEFKGEYHDGQTAIAETFSLLGAKTENGDGFVFNLNSVKISPTQSFAQYLQSVSARFGEIEGTVTDLRTVLVEAGGGVVAKAVFALNVNGHVVGTVQTNNGQLGEITFVYDRARFLRPDGTLMWGYDETANVIVMPNVRVNTLEAQTVKTASIAPGQVTGLWSASYPDVLVSGGEVTLAEMTNYVVGDATDGKALLELQFTQDGTINIDTAMRLRCYMDFGSGYQLIRDVPQGIGVSSGNARWILNSGFKLPIVVNGPVNIKITAAPYAIPGGGTSSSSYARNILIMIFEGFR